MNRKGTYIASRKPSSLRKHALAQTCWRNCADLLVFISVLFLIFSFVFVISAVAQSTKPSPVNSGTGGDSKSGSEDQTSPIEIHLDNPSKELWRYSFRGLEPPAETAIQFHKGPKPWSFVKFDQLPEHVTMIVKGDPDPYQESESLKSDTWYPFRQMLPVVVKIDRDAKPPVRLKFDFGYPNKNDDIIFNTNPSAQDVRDFAATHVLDETNTQVLDFYWGPSVVTFDSTSIAFQADAIFPKRVTLTGEPGRWTIVRVPELPKGIQLTINTTSPDNLTGNINTEIKAGEWIGFKGSASLGVELNSSELNPNVNSTTLNIETAIARSPGQTKHSINADIKEGKIISNGFIPLAVSWESPGGGLSWGKIQIAVGIVLLVAAAIVLWKVINKDRRGESTLRQTEKGPAFGPDPSKRHRPHNRDGSVEDKVRGSTPGINSGSTTAASSPKPAPSPEPVPSVAPANVQTTSPSIHSGASSDDYRVIPNGDFEQLRAELQNLRNEFHTHINQFPRNFVTSEDVNQQLSEFQQRTENSFREGLKNLRSEREQVSSAVENNRKATEEEIRKLYLRLDEISEQNIKSTSDAERQIKSHLDQFQQMLSEQAFPESYFARTMGMILSKNIDNLQEGNLERLIGESLNHFFQAEVPRSESLQELRQRSESIVAALKQVVEIISRKKPDVEHEARLRMGRAEALLAKISGFQTELQSRKLTIETTLRINVSAYSGARQTFLEELGRGIRSELDKLGDPQSYFEGDLERLVTADLIAIVDICDKKVSSPIGSDSELESALKQLFMHAGLRPIVPSPGEPFGTAEQDLVQMVPGAPGTNMTIATVVTRGFYYTRRDNETLLRKPGVTVYG